MSYPQQRRYRGVNRLSFALGTVAGLMLWGGFAQAASTANLNMIGHDADELAGVQIPLDESCAALQVEGAERLLLLSPESQPDKAILLGLENAKVLWAQPVPWQDDHGGFNSVKTAGSCDGKQLTLYSQMPYWAATFIQTFEQNGRELHFLSHGFADASAEILEAAIVAVETQGAEPVAPEGLESPFEGLMYPHNYIHRYSMEAAIARGHAAALAQYKAGETEVAAKILQEMFELTRSLHTLVGGSSQMESLTPLQQWVAVWWEQDIPWQTYTPALNDYGFFLQELGEHGEAIGMLEAVVELAPNRTVAYLNLADSQWQLGQRAAAQRNYETYAWQMEQQNLGAQIPARAIQRQR